ncbi:MAG: MFS transporter [Clostridiales bacterium]|nr:MFS transporter [Clostridiales bacterium]
MIKEKLADLKEKIFGDNSLSPKEQFGYAGGVFGNSMGQDSVNTFSDKFLRGYTKISNRRMTIMGDIFNIAGLIISPIVGNIVDTPAKKNKRTPTKTILMLAPVPFSITSMLLFIVPFSNPFYNFLWAFISKFIYNTSDVFYDTSLNATSLRMTDNANDRKNLYTLATFAQSLGAMLPGWLIPIVVGLAKTPAGKQRSYFFVALIFCIIGLITMFAPYFTINENLRVEKRPEKVKLNWDSKTFSTMLHSRSFLAIQAGNFFEQIRQISYKLLPYIYEDCFDDLKMKAAIDALSGSLSYAGLVATPKINSKFSPRTVMSGSFAFTGVFYILMSVFAFRYNSAKMKKYRYLVGLMLGLAGMPNNAIIATKKILLGDSTDYMEWYSTKKYGTPIRSEGLISATQSLLGSLYNFLRTRFYNTTFERIGYVTGASKEGITQSTKTLRGIYLMFTLCGVVGNFLAAGAYLLDDFHGAKKAAIMEELTEFRNERKKLQEELEETNDETTIDAN